MSSAIEPATCTRAECRDDGATVPLSVVIATTKAWPEIEPCLESLHDQAQAVGVEVLVGDGHGQGLPLDVADRYPEVKWIKWPGGSVFFLRELAMTQVHGAVVAVTEDHCTVSPWWCERILKAHRDHPEAAAIGGVVENGATTRLIDWSNFLIVFGPFTAPIENGTQRVISLQANISYKRRVVPRKMSQLGMMEFLFNRKLHEHAPASVQLTPNRSTISADGEDVSVITVSVTDAQGRIVPVASNLIQFAVSGAGKILGVGNGDPSCHEPDTFVAQLPIKTIAVEGWHWKLASVPNKGALVPEYANAFDDSAWSVIKPKTDGDTGDQVLHEGETGIFRAHVTLTEADLANPGVQVRFGGIDDHGWIFVNNQRVGESADWAAQPAFDIKKKLHAGDNVIAVGVANESSMGGLNPDVNVELVGKPVANAWSRSVFNGLAQIMVQSTREAGEIKLTATAEGLQPVTTTITTQAGATRPFVP